MRVLGIDSATANASVGLWSDGSIVAEQHTSSRNHAASLLPLIDAVLSEAGCAIAQLDALAVSAGPGSFSGLRVGLSIAKGVALASGLPIFAVSTLEALAATIADREGYICCLIDAHKGELYMACFEARAARLRRLSEDCIVTVGDAAASMPKPCVVIGDAMQRYGDSLSSIADVEILPFPAFGPRGGIVAALGATQGQGGVDSASLEPFYIRPPEVRVSA